MVWKSRFQEANQICFTASIPLDMRHYKEKVISYILKIFHQIMSHFIILIIKKNVFEKLGIVLKNFVWL